MRKELTREEKANLLKHLQLVVHLSEALESEMLYLRDWFHADIKRIVQINIECNKKFKNRILKTLPKEVSLNEENKALDKLEELYKIFGL